MKRGFRLASTMLLLVTMVLGAITALFVLLAPVVMPLFAPGFKDNQQLLDLTRVQMNPPQGSTDQVRWRQCESL